MIEQSKNPKFTKQNQNNKIVKKSSKHDVNLQQNTTLYFQVGLIVCLLLAYSLIEMKFETILPPDIALIDTSNKLPEEISVKKFEIYKEPAVEIKPKATKKIILNKEIEIVDDDFSTEDLVKNNLLDKDITPDDTHNEPSLDVYVPDEDIILPIINIEKVPVYPGCENSKNNIERKKCLSYKITKLIQRKFNSGVAEGYGLTGRQKIDVQFTIDKTGHITNVKTRAPHPKLKEEAERVISIIPKMTPGRQQDKNVGVIYNLPIIFQIE